MAGAAMNWGVSVGLSQFIAFFAERQILAAFIGVLVGTVSNFLLCLRIVFRARPNPAAKKSDPTESPALTESRSSAEKDG
jgi:putative flippase GtrA